MRLFTLALSLAYNKSEFIKILQRKSYKFFFVIRRQICGFGGLCY